MARYDIPPTTHTAGQVALGFRVDGVTELTDVRARAYECTHLATGARLLHIHANDEENLYAIAFRTPPADSTGIPHIVEHSVLAGSKRYPVKDAFNELSKGTLNTFLNAMTWPDKTIYPVCSAVHADYFNLAAVYTDLVFHPLMSEQTFQQEGHHLEIANLDDTSSDLIVSGVVYNEMKGVYSSPDRVVYKIIQEGIYPDNCYSVDSGGDPDVIPSLTHEQFVNFHRTYYSPSNARWYLYGDIPLADHLSFISKQLEGFGSVSVKSEIKPQVRWTKPRRVDGAYPISADEGTAEKTFIQVSWMMESMVKPEQVILFDILREALIGNAAGPLRKALVDSRLGQDLSPVSGHDTDFLQTLFTVGLRGSEPERAEPVENLILTTLAKIAQEGLDPELLAAAFHQIEFRGREIVPPFPIMLLFRAAAPANYGADPKVGVEFGKLVESTRRRYAQEPELFVRLIREWFLENPHRLLSVVRPSTTLDAEREKALAERLAQRKAGMTAQEVDRIRDDARVLKKVQVAADPPEALATLPRLRLEEVPKRVRTIPTERGTQYGVQTLEHPVFSNGVAYIQLAFDVSDLTHEEAPWVPLLGDATVGLGAGGLDYAALATRIARETGGIDADLMVGKPLSGGKVFQQLIFEGRALKAGIGPLFAIIRDLFTSSDTGDTKRLRDLIHESKNDLLASVHQRGSEFAAIRASASLDLARFRQEQWRGTSQIRFMSELARQADSDPSAISARLKSLQRRVFSRDKLMASLTGDPELVEAMRAPLAGLIASLGTGAATAEPGPLPAQERDAGIAISSQVNYVCQVLPVVSIGDPVAPAIEVLSSLLSSEYLYTRLRLQGGAYGGFASYRPADGLLIMASYRDPHLVETLDVFAKVAEFVQGDTLTEDLLARSKIGVIGGFDRILAPQGQGMASLRWHLLGLTDDTRKAFRDGLFNVSLADLRGPALAAIEGAFPAGPRAVLAPRSAIEEANSKIQKPFAVVALE